MKTTMSLHRSASCNVSCHSWNMSTRACTDGDARSHTRTGNSWRSHTRFVRARRSSTSDVESKTTPTTVMITTATSDRIPPIECYVSCAAPPSYALCHPSVPSSTNNDADDIAQGTPSNVYGALINADHADHAVCRLSSSQSLSHSTTRGPFRTDTIADVSGGGNNNATDVINERRVQPSVYVSPCESSTPSPLSLEESSPTSCDATWRSAMTVAFLSFHRSAFFDVPLPFNAAWKTTTKPMTTTKTGFPSYFLPLLLLLLQLQFPVLQFPTAMAQTSSSIPTLTHSFPTLLDGLPGSQLSLNHLALDHDTGEDGGG